MSTPASESNRKYSQREIQLAKIAAIERDKKRRWELPHIYGWSWYEWAHSFFTTRNKMALLTAANQVSKSSTQIRKCLHMATCVEEWPSWWSTKPKQFWYLYPTKDVSTIEFNEKWVPEFMPRGAMITDPIFGWTTEYTAMKKIHAIYFNSGVSIYFKSYAQDATDLQTGTAHAIFCDEELQLNLFDELKFRLAATDGYFSMVFTATLGQEMWRLAMEPIEGEQEMFPDAWKRTISLYDCQYYKDGTASQWTPERIAQIVSSCSSESEVARRVMGRFVKSGNLVFHTYSPQRHRYKSSTPGRVLEEWEIHCAVDLGSGASSAMSHPAAIVFLAVDPTRTKVRVFRAWRGDRIKTTAGDVYEVYKTMRDSIGREPLVKSYDYESADFGIIVERAQDFWYRAEKSVARGQELVNSLFRANALEIEMDDSELNKLSSELQSVSNSGGQQKDDLVSALRYAIMKIPMDWTKILAEGDKTPAKKEMESSPEAKRREYWDPKDETGLFDGVEQEMEYWAELMD